jgi:hypothetical protein
MTPNNDGDDNGDRVGRPTVEEGDLYIFTEEDLAELTAELFERLRARDDIDTGTADELSHEVFSLLTDPEQNIHE